MKNKNLVNLILSFHTPFIPHIENEEHFEEKWYFENVCESYLPLIRMIKERDDNNAFNIVLSFSPSLLSMMMDNDYNNRLLEYINNHILLGEKEIIRLKDEKKMLSVAENTLKEYQLLKKEFVEEYNSNVFNAIQILKEKKGVEISLSPFTNTFFPVFQTSPLLIKSSIALSSNAFNTNFKDYPKGFLLPENGYYPGLFKVLKNNIPSLLWSVVSPVAFALSESKIKNGAYKPLKCENSIYAFSLDLGIEDLVVSVYDGYPGDDEYREFYRDIGFDLPLSYIGEFTEIKNKPSYTGYKYWAVSGKKDNKNIYDEKKAMNKVKSHSHHFLSEIQKKGKKVSSFIDSDPVFTLRFDADLFGHMWKEGIVWLKNIFEYAKDYDVCFTTPTEYLKEYKDFQNVDCLSLSSTTYNTYVYPFISSDCDDIQKDIILYAKKVENICSRFKDESNSIKTRYLRALVSQMLLLSSSDWVNLLHNKIGSVYTLSIIKEHMKNIDYLLDILSRNKSDTAFLVKLEKKYPLFENIDFNTFS